MGLRRFVASDGLYTLTSNLQRILFQHLVDLAHPFHDFALMRDTRVTDMEYLQTIAARILGDIAARFRRL